MSGERYCIGCIHLHYADKRMGFSSWTGAWTASDAAISCAKGHWTRYLESGPIGGLDMEQAMLNAATCPDYQQREAA